MNFNDIKFVISILQRSENSGFVWRVCEGKIIIQAPLKLYNEIYEINNFEEFNIFCSKILNSALS
ncbi:hypothetical protein [Sporosarcina sp. A2]|uniref:hypothetical protein n=1 Tax=Sporosarcina sp. A2 TaxID=3393449 RepID=UPI003D799930